MEPIRLNDLLHLDAETLERTKVRLMSAPTADPANDPLKQYKADPNKVTEGWFLWKDKKNAFKPGELGLGLLELGHDEWLLVTAKTIIRELPQSQPGIGYDAQIEAGYLKYFGRVIIGYHRTATGSTIFKAATIMDDLEVLEILRNPYR